VIEETIKSFQTAEPEERLRMARDDSNREALDMYLGKTAYDEYRKLANRLADQHLSIRAAPNLIFVPGVMGSLLQSQTKGGIWWVDARTRGHINDLKLSPDGKEDADPNNQIIPCSTDPTYEPFLTAALERNEFGHVVFPYDWRKSLTLSTGALKNRIMQVHEANGHQPVHLVAHSMGGLLVRATLMDHGLELWPKLGRIVFIGTPHYGSSAIAGYLKNHLWGFDLMALLGRYLSRETFRSLRGVLSMLPAPRGIYPGTRPDDTAPWTGGDPTDAYAHPCVNFDVYQADNWKLGLTTEETAHLQGVLAEVTQYHERMYFGHRALDQSLRDRMLVIAGVGFRTLFRLAYQTQFFGVWERTAKVMDRIEDDLHREGDGRVPLASAALEDVAIRYVKGIHGGLPNIPAVYNDVFRWLKDESLELSDTVRGALSQHLAPEETESEAPHLDGTARVIPFTDNPGFWDLTALDGSQLASLDTKLASGQIPEFITVRLL